MFGNLQDARWMYLKGALFLALGVLASALLIALHPAWELIGLHALAVWAFCRAYYFAFYVIEHYVDGAFRYDGLIAFFRHTLSGRLHPPEPPHARDP